MPKIISATDESVQEAASIIRNGGLVAFPTETVYGLGANALDAEAAKNIFAAKGRPATNPLIVHVADPNLIQDFAEPHAASLRIVNCFWPGPLTIILPRRANVPDVITAGGDTVAVRIPNHPTALALLKAAGVPIAAPSANRSEEISPTTAQHVADSLGDAVDLILDGGPCEVGLESTVLNALVDPPVILRPGAITPEMIESETGVRPIYLPKQNNASDPAASPGQMRRHYAPRTPLVVSNDAVADFQRLGGRSGLLLNDFSTDIQSDDAIALTGDAQAYAAKLYAALRQLDAGGYDRIIVEAVPAGDEWAAIRDRLSRAAEPPA